MTSSVVVGAAGVRDVVDDFWEGFVGVARDSLRRSSRWDCFGNDVALDDD